MNRTRTWHKGPPPHIGWWNASRAHANDMWRWWDGKQWSHAVHSARSASTAADCAGLPDDGWHVDWTDYYPPGARVPRINPEAAK